MFPIEAAKVQLPEVGDTLAPLAVALTRPPGFVFGAEPPSSFTVTVQVTTKPMGTEPLPQSTLVEVLFGPGTKVAVGVGVGVFAGVDVCVGVGVDVFVGVGVNVDVFVGVGVGGLTVTTG